MVFAPVQTDGVGYEAASFKDGTRGIISTVQIQSPSPHYENISLFTALWDVDQKPAYGMYYADGSYGNALVIRKRNGGTAGDTQIRLVDYESGVTPSNSRDRFVVFDDGAVRISSQKFTGSGSSSSPQLTLRGSYYSAGNQDLDWKLQNIVFSTTAPRCRLAILDPSVSPVERVTVQDDGKVGIGNTSPKLILHTANSAVALGAPTSAAADADLNNSNLTFWIDESASTKKLVIKVKLSTGSIKTATIDLVP